MILVYDKSFEGFLTLVYEVYYQKIEVSEIKKSMPKSLFLDDIKEIITDETKALKVYEAMENKFYDDSFKLINNIFMCDKEEFELDLLAFIVLGFKNKNEQKNINNPCVFKLENLQKELFRNYHKMSGFLRFKELDDNTLYAKIENRFNLVALLGKHFIKRLNNQNFIIHDINREIALIKNEKNISINQILEFDEPVYSKDEEKFDKLWNQFFKSVSIKSRENLKLQQNQVPLIYRKYMTEF